MCSIRLFLSLLLTLGCFAAYAQGNDSACSRRDQGLKDIEQQRYVDAYWNLKYYFDNEPGWKRKSPDYINAVEKYKLAVRQIADKCAKCYMEAMDAHRQGQQERLDSLCDAYLRMCVPEELKRTADYSFVLTQYALACNRKGLHERSLIHLRKALQVQQLSELIDRTDMAETLNYMAMVENQTGDYTAAIDHCTRALRLYEKRYKKKGEFYGNTLINLANYHESRNNPGDIDRAIELNEEALEVLSKKSTGYAKARNKLIVLYTYTNNQSKSQELVKEEYEYVKKMRKKDGNSLNYATTLGNDAIHFAMSNNYTAAIGMSLQAIEIYRANGETTSLNFALLLSNTAQFEKHEEKYANAIPRWQEAAAIFKSIEGNDGSNYLSCMGELMTAYVKIGEGDKAEDISKVLYDTNADDNNNLNRNYAIMLMHNAEYMAGEGNYKKAVEYQQQVLSVYHLRQEIADEANALNVLSNYLYHMGELEQAIDSCRKALDLYDTLGGQDIARAQAFNSLSIYYYAARRFDDAIDASRQAATLFEMSGTPYSSLYSKILTNQSLYEAVRGNIDSAFVLCKFADRIQRSILGDIHPDNVVLRFNLANYCLEMNKPDDAQRYFHDALTMQMKHVRSKFSHLTTQGRELYWDSRSYVFHSAPYMACRIEQNDSILVDTYNALLFTKGLLLNTEIDFRKLLESTSSSKVQQKYEKFTSIYNEIEGIWRNPTEETKSRLPELMKEHNRLEKELMKDSKEFGDFTESMSTTFSQIVSCLQEDEAAIEFFDIKTNSGDRVYWALVARKGYSAPKLIRMFSGRKLNTVNFSGFPLTEALNKEETVGAVYDDPEVGKLVWEKIVNELHDVSRVWFSPSGLFYQWGIEYLLYSGQRINERYSMHRVSSTKMLVHRSESHGKPITRAAVFGGLDYEASEGELVSANEVLKERQSEWSRDYLSEITMQSSLDSLDMAMSEKRTMAAILRDGRGRVGYLSGTEQEADRVGARLMMNDITSEIYKGAYGTEEAFKKLSGRRDSLSKISLLHIATHGFSFSPDEVGSNSDALAYLNVMGGQAIQSDNSLCFSGLLLSGANNVLSGKKLSRGMENGVLTAREIAMLDFSGLNLAVLSACQTGIGELKEDGVFGVQRGFKKAGAKTLLMSLWEVDDTATQMLMEEFYRVLLEGNSPTSAFHQAQNALRNNPGYSSPFYWASFIILDDIF